MRAIKLLVFLMIFVLLSACANLLPSSPTPSNGAGTGQGQPNAQGQPTQGQPNAAVAPTPESGKTTVVGRILSAQTGQPMNETTVRLAEVYREGDQAAFTLSGAWSPGAVTDANGNFVMANIEAREYVLIVGDVNGRHVIWPEAPGSDSARIWDALANQVLDIGQIDVDLPQS
ncbi:MAG: carboxypeptidase-like regulatory domain-containing protein [Chloroflexales bacterium]|nr:carboxypeptidase-like regulatory domain-containing protein [Chloroflexales bacterium]